MAERVLTERELNRALLARQLLLSRVNLPMPRAIERIGYLQTQYAPSAYLGLWSRVEGFERAHLTRALERRAVIQATLMRVTIHMISRREYWPVVEAIRDERRTGWLKATRHLQGAPHMEAHARRVRTALAGQPRRRAEIVAELGLDSTTWNGVGLWLELVRVPPSGTWEQRRADLYGLAEDWVGPPNGTRDRGLELLDLPRAPLPGADAPAPPRFLPTWDATLLVHARRTQILPEPYRALVFNTRTPHSVSTFLVDGRAAGTWTEERGRVRLRPFDLLPRATPRELEDETSRLEAFLA